MSSQPNILIADDEETFLSATVDLFHDEGYECHCVTTAEDALSAMAATRFDLLVTDINMPGNGGLELLSAIQDFHPNMPVIVVTGYPSVPTAISSLRFRVLDYLSKPIDWPHLLHTVDQGLGQARIRDAISRAKTAAMGWAKNLESIEEGFSFPNSEMRDAWTLTDNFLEQSMGKIHTELGALRIALSTAKGHYAGPSQDLCQIIHCSRANDYHRLRLAIQHTMDTLQKTKGSFKSKELGALRLQLSDLLKETQPST